MHGSQNRRDIRVGQPTEQSRFVGHLRLVAQRSGHEGIRQPRGDDGTTGAAMANLGLQRAHVRCQPLLSALAFRYMNDARHRREGRVIVTSDEEGAAQEHGFHA